MTDDAPDAVQQEILRQETQLLEALAEHVSSNEALKLMAGLCFMIERTAPAGSGFAYGAHMCGDKIAAIAVRLQIHLNKFGKP